ncbi:hypothetical protein BX666DRAFT_2018123 [Dichotomocladium elegans]|nr:hypothetical protein BX666DRAFT_2018123 [Dichotomocladium elegans]
MTVTLQHNNVFSIFIHHIPRSVFMNQRGHVNAASTPSHEAVAAQTSAFQDLLGLSGPNPDLKNTFYQRQLPETLVRFSSDEGKKLFRSAMEAGHAEGFFPLTGNFTTQSEPAYCGPSSLAMVLNALEVDPKRRWKGNWRWYSGNEYNLEEFRKDVADVTMRSDKFMVISFSRKTLGQTGDGHFSPIGAYNPDSDMVLVLDTARYKYPSYWCPVEMLYESMKPIDKETGRPRGYFLLSYDAERPPVSLCKVSSKQQQQQQRQHQKQQDQSQPVQFEPSSPTSPSHASPSTPLNWSTLAQSFCKRIPENMWFEKPRTLSHVVQLVLRNVPPEYTVILANQSLSRARSSSADQARTYIDQLLHDTTQSALYPVVLDALYPNRQQQQQQDGVSSTPPSSVDHHAAFATLFMLGSPRMLYTSLPRELQESLDKFRRDESVTEIVKHEVDRISVEVSELTKTFCTCGPGWTTSIAESSKTKSCVNVPVS